ncbi:MAG: type II CAAX endopeptidase family protein [Alkalibacterium sp.]|uniref:CPBP family intramembrane glutamic endopeptidase n=1 Tax=Alkalibacterium sp. TaxID=1872447 RepID=UPI003970E523
MYQRTFKHATLWGLLWRSFFALVGVVILTTILFLAFGQEHIFFIRILSDSLLYFLVYKIIISLMKKQSLSIRSVAKSDPKKWDELLEISGWTLLTAVVATSFSIFLLTVISFIPNAYETIIPYIEELANGDDISFIYLFVIAVIVAPIVEEIIFRGYIMNKWADKYSLKKGIIYSSLLFMLFHVQSFFIPQLLLGLLCALVYVKFNNLFYAIFTHSLYNLLVILPAFLVPDDGDMAVDSLLALSEELPADYLIFSAVFIIGLLVILLLFTKLFRSIKDQSSPYVENLNQ